MNSRLFKPSDAAKLEAPERQIWLPPKQMLDYMSLHDGDTVADIGAGTGYFALPISVAVGHAGRVLAVDSQPEMLELLRNKLTSHTTRNLELVQGSAARTTLPDAIADVVLIANVWHELDDLPAVVRELRRITKPTGRLAVLDWRTDVTQPPGPPLAHRVTSEDVARVLSTDHWQPSQINNIGSYSYLVLANPT